MHAACHFFISEIGACTIAASASCDTITNVPPQPEPSTFQASAASNGMAAAFVTQFFDAPQAWASHRPRLNGSAAEDSAENSGRRLSNHQRLASTFKPEPERPTGDFTFFLRSCKNFFWNAGNLGALTIASQNSDKWTDEGSGIEPLWAIDMECKHISYSCLLTESLCRTHSPSLSPSLPHTKTHKNASHQIQLHSQSGAHTRIRYVTLPLRIKPSE